MARGIATWVNAIFIAFHAFSFVALTFLRLFPYDASNKPRNTFHIDQFGLGWWSTYVQWAYWATIFYFLMATLGDCFMRRVYRAHKDRFFLFVFTIQSSIGFTYWLIYVPINGSPSTVNYNSILENYMSTSIPLVLLWIELFIVTHKYGHLIMEMLVPFTFYVGFFLSEMIRYYLVRHEINYIMLGALVAAHIVFYFVGRGLSKLMRKVRMGRVCCEKLLYDSDAEEMDYLGQEQLLIQNTYNDEEREGCLHYVGPLLSVVISVIVINATFLIIYLLVERSRREIP